MRLNVGPVEPASAAAWIQWAEATFGELGPDLRYYLEQWKPQTCAQQGDFRWQGEVDPDRLEYLVHAFFNLDAGLSDDAQEGVRSPAPAQGREFYLSLVHGLLHALEIESPGRAAFADQLRSSWPIAGEAT